MASDLFLRLFGQHVKYLRLKNELTVKDLASRCGVKEEYIIGIEEGEIDCEINFVIELASSLNLKAHELLSFEL